MYRGFRDYPVFVRGLALAPLQRGALDMIAHVSRLFALDRALTGFGLGLYLSTLLNVRIRHEAAQLRAGSSVALSNVDARKCCL